MDASGASQLGGSSDRTVCVLRIGSFNVGIDQNMLKSKKVRQYLNKVEDIIAACVQDAGLHIMNLCELGGHLEGLSAAGILATHLKLFQDPAPPSVSINSNYLTAWGFEADATQLA